MAATIARRTGVVPPAAVTAVPLGRVTRPLRRSAGRERGAGIPDADADADADGDADADADADGNADAVADAFAEGLIGSGMGTAWLAMARRKGVLAA